MLLSLHSQSTLGVRCEDQACAHAEASPIPVANAEIWWEGTCLLHQTLLEEQSQNVVSRQTLNHRTGECIEYHHILPGTGYACPLSGPMMDLEQDVTAST